MSAKILSEQADLDWLFETHLEDLRNWISWEPRCAVIYGNEDCPSEIDLYPRRAPKITDKPLTGHYHDDIDKYVFCGPLDYAEAIAIDQEERTKKSFHFSIGDSSNGPIGFCARVEAATKEQAVDRLRSALDNLQTSVDSREHAIYDDCVDDADQSPGEGIEYLRVYFNPDAIQVDDIDSVD